MMKILSDSELHCIGGGISVEMVTAFSLGLGFLPVAYFAGSTVASSLTDGAVTATKNELNMLNKRTGILDRDFQILAENMHAVTPVAVTQIK